MVCTDLFADAAITVSVGLLRTVRKINFNNHIKAHKDHQLDGLCTGVHSVHTGVLMAKCALLTWGHRPELTLFFRVIDQSAQFTEAVNWFKTI